jgi:hypothetical protein
MYFVAFLPDFFCLFASWEKVFFSFYEVFILVIFGSLVEFFFETFLLTVVRCGKMGKGKARRKNCFKEKETKGRMRGENEKLVSGLFW